MWRLTQCQVLQQVWSQGRTLGPDTEMCSGRSNFPGSFPHVYSLLIQRISNHLSRKINTISFISVWISQKNQPLLEFKSQVIVQNHVPRQPYNQQHNSGFPFWFFPFSSTSFKLIYKFCLLVHDVNPKRLDSNKHSRVKNIQTFGGCVQEQEFER